MPRIEKLLAGNDLRSLGRVNVVITQIRNQKDFEKLFNYLYHWDRAVVMRAADAIEKITTNKHSYLNRHKSEILGLCRKASHKELKWHLAQIIPRLDLNSNERSRIWKILKGWAVDKDESRIVRVNSLQALFELSAKKPSSWLDITKLVVALEKENVPSINARIGLIRRGLPDKIIN